MMKIVKCVRYIGARSEHCSRPNSLLGWISPCRQVSAASFVCGFVVVNELNITNLAVDESFRKKGIGKKMLLKIFLEARNLGAEEALLEVNVNNISAINFYKNFGFHTISIRSNYYGANEDAKLMKMTF